MASSAPVVLWDKSIEDFRQRADGEATTGSFQTFPIVTKPLSTSKNETNKITAGSMIFDADDHNPFSGTFRASVTKSGGGSATGIVELFDLTENVQLGTVSISTGDTFAVKETSVTVSADSAPHILVANIWRASGSGQVQVEAATLAVQEV